MASHRGSSKRPALCTMVLLLLASTLTVIEAVAASAQAQSITITFSNLQCCPSSYEENGLIVRSDYPPPGAGHLHDGSAIDGRTLFNHDGGCCSDPYRFDMSNGATFSVSQFQIRTYGYTHVFRAVPTGAMATVTQDGTVALGTGWQNIEFFTWDVGGGGVGDTPGVGEIDNLVLGTTTAGAPATLTLSPKLASNEVGDQHCATATVHDAFGNPVAGANVRFEFAGANPTQGARTTDQAGVARFCYVGRTIGADSITAYVDTDNDGTRDAGEPADTAEKTWAAGAPQTLVLQPRAATNPVGDQHCVGATVRDAFTNPVRGQRVRFQVTGTTSRTGADLTDDAGQAQFCYSSTTVGVDTILAHVDTDNDNTRDTGEPFDTAEKTWVPATPRTLGLHPKEGTNPVGTRHCVLAEVRDAFDNRTRGITVRFTVTGANPQPMASDTTDENGLADYCYTGTRSGVDVITAYADVNRNNVMEAGEPTDVAEKTWLPLAPHVVELEPKTDVNQVDTEHCVVADVRDVFGNPVPNVRVRFQVAGVHQRAGSDATDELGSAEFCYTGELVGEDVITAFADQDQDETQDAGEPADAATKTWTVPASTPGCEVTITDGGWIVTATGSKGTFGGNARVGLDGTTSGEEEFQDHNQIQPLDFHSLTIDAVVCRADATRADIFGTGEVDGVPVGPFRIRVRDAGEPARGTDTYQIMWTGYASGPEDNPIMGGNIQIHKFG